MLTSFFTKPLIVYLIMALIALSTFAGPAEAMFVPAASDQGEAGAAAASVVRTADLAKIQTALESKVLRQKLVDYGLSPEKAMSQLNKLSDEQVHQLTAHTDSLQAGGANGVAVIILVAVWLVLIVQVIYLIIAVPGE